MVPNSDLDHKELKVIIDLTCLCTKMNICTMLLLNLSIYNKQLDIWPPSVILTLQVHTWFLHMTHRIMVVNISAKNIQNPSRKDKVMKWTQIKDPIFDIWTLCDLDLGVQTWFLNITHYLIVVKISAKLPQNPSGNDKVIKWTLFVTSIHSDRQYQNVFPTTMWGETLHVTLKFHMYVKLQFNWRW